MGDELEDEVDALWPATLVDALIRAKAKLSSKTNTRTLAVKRLAKIFYGLENRNVRPHLSVTTQS